MIEALALVLGAALAVACVLFAARPFLRDAAAAPGRDRLPEPDAAARERIRLEDERDRALAALKELEFDHRTGKVSDDDYRAALPPLRRQAAGPLRALDEEQGVRPRRVGHTSGMETPPEPARVPEPWPPPDEGEIPDPLPTPPRPTPEEPPEPQHPPAPQTGEQTAR